MAKRLRISKKLLAPNGFIAISIDDNEIAQLKILLDEIFNEKTKIIAVKMSEASGLKMSSVYRLGTIPKYKEYLLLAKPSGISNFKFKNIPKGQWDDEYNIFIEDLDEKTRAEIDEYSNKENLDDEAICELDKIAATLTLKSVSEKHKELGISKKAEKEKWNFENAWRICQCATSSSVLRLAEEKKKSNTDNLFFVKSIRDGKLYFVRANYSSNSKKPRVQLIFANDNLSYHPGDFWSDIKTTGLEAEGGVEFKNGKKPLKLLTRIIQSNPNINSIILDFFAGSGTTLHATMQINAEDGGRRQCILVTNNENNICEEVTYERNKRVIQGFTNAKGQQVPGLTQNNLRYYKSAFVPSMVSEPNKRLLTQRSTELLCIKESCYTELTEANGFNPAQCRLFTNGKGKYLTIVFHSRQQAAVCEQLIGYIKNLSELSEPVRLYAFSPEKETLAEDFWEVTDKIDAVPLPEAIYNAYKATFRTLKLDRSIVAAPAEPASETETIAADLFNTAEA